MRAVLVQWEVPRVRSWVRVPRVQQWQTFHLKKICAYNGEDKYIHKFEGIYLRFFFINIM